MIISKEIESIKERVSHDEDALFLIEDFVETCNRYVSIVVSMENSIGTARFRLENEDYKQFVMNIDNRRRTAHDALMSSVRVVNRLSKLFHGNVEDRVEVGDFAKQVVDSYFEGRRR